MKKTFATFLLGVAAITSPACGPYFPPSYLASDTPRIMDTELTYNLALLGNHFFPGIIRAADSPDGTKEFTTFEATRRDFLSVGSERQLADYLTFDAACRKGEEPPANPDALPPELREFYLYSQGYSEMFRNPECFEPEAWKQLLALPPEQRQYRTTWVCYMLGNLALRRNADEAYRRYQSLRQAAAGGFNDTLHLAALSFRTNWEQARKPSDQLRYLTVHAANGGAIWKESFRRICSEIRGSDGQAAASDSFLREILLLEAENPTEILDRIPEGETLLIPERLAARSYFTNNLKECRALLDRIPADSLIRLYLEARLARRDGDFGLAAKKLSQWLEVYRKNPACGENAIFYADYRNSYYEDHNSPIRLTHEVQGVLGTILVQQQDFLEALHAFMQADAWRDAATVAEQMLPTDTLLEYCRNHAGDPDKPMQKNLRYLLARRLMREFRVREAAQWFPADVKPFYNLYISRTAEANNPDKTPDERAIALFELGRLLMQNGLQLRGTEMEPDLFLLGGNYPQLESPRETPELKLSQRFHYRRNAADCFARGAFLAADPTLRSACLWAAGEAIKIRQPQQANEYYLMLCDSGDAPMAQAAREQRWFPPNPALRKLLRETPPDSPVTLEALRETVKTFFKQN